MTRFPDPAIPVKIVKTYYYVLKSVKENSQLLWLIITSQVRGIHYFAQFKIMYGEIFFLASKMVLETTKFRKTLMSLIQGKALVKGYSGIFLQI